MTLRDRLIALADADAVCDDDKPYTRSLALASARMALEDAIRECAPPNAWDQEDCVTELRAMRDGLDK